VPPKKPSWLGWTAMILPAVLVIAFVAISTKPTLHRNPPAIVIAVAGPDGALWQIANPSGAVAARLKKQFPPGTPVAKMRRTLEDEGFAPIPDRVRCKPASPSQAGNRLVCWTPPHPEWQMGYAWGRDDCNQAILVRWDEDTHGNLKTLSYDYKSACR
jgi:hypothetical protein